MSEPDGPDATRRALLRGVVVLGAVGVGAGLSRIGEGTVDLTSATGAESDVATQAPPAETAAPEPTASAKPTKSTKQAKKEPKPAASAEPTKSTKSTKSTQSAKQTKKEPKPAKPAGKPLGPANKVPVGGGVVYKGDKVVVTQPTAGVYKAFDATCTHANCLVDEVKDGTINCPCHFAKFSIADGSVKKFPARKPLPPKTVTESGGTLYLG